MLRWQMINISSRITSEAQPGHVSFHNHMHPCGTRQPQLLSFEGLQHYFGQLSPLSRQGAQPHSNPGTITILVGAP